MWLLDASGAFGGYDGGGGFFNEFHNKTLNNKLLGELPRLAIETVTVVNRGERMTPSQIGREASFLEWIHKKFAGLQSESEVRRKSQT